MRIIGIRLYGGSDSVIKNLKPGWYPFGDYQEPTLDMANEDFLNFGSSLPLYLKKD